MAPHKQRKQLNLSQYGALTLRLLLVLLFYSFSRLFFFLFNPGYFAVPEDFGTTEYLLQVFGGGGRFDIAAVLYVNAPYIIACILPFTFRNHPMYKKVTSVVFYYLFNIIAFAFDYIDIIYFRFTEKRMTFDIFRFAETEGGFVHLIPDFVRDYWYVFLIFIIMMGLFVQAGSRIVSIAKKKQPFTVQWFLKNLLYAVVVAGVFIVGTRGGFQRRPIALATASIYSKTGNDAFVLNTPFSVLTTANKSNALTPVKYFDDNTLRSIYSPIRQYNNRQPFRFKNVAIVVLEGFSAEHSMYFNPAATKSYMPHVDEIARKGSALICYSNGMKSMEGIPAIVSGIPSLMHNEYLTSSYAGNNISGLPLILKEKKYKSAFFHGGNNGTMKFDSYASLVGFHYYYGAREYDNMKDHDGAWGIYDGPFLQYCLNQIDTIGEPFFSTIFTLSSHHPYALPKDYRATLENPNQEIGIRESIEYADHAIGRFMEAAEKRPWFNNTLFVFTADHASQSFDSVYSRLKRYEIPLILYAPGDSIPEFRAALTQQIDIMPSVLHYLNYSEPFFAFGQSVFADEYKPFSINYGNGVHQFITENRTYMFDGDTVTSFYDTKMPYSPRNLLRQEPLPQDDYDFMRAFIQTYNTSLIENRLTLKRYEQQ